MTKVTIQGDPQGLLAWLGDDGLPISVEGGSSAIVVGPHGKIALGKDGSSGTPRGH
jgi:hypothetical protein